MSKIDPVQFEVIRNALVEATEEMSIALKRSAYSTNIKTRTDFSCAFFDRHLRPVAQASGQPVHLGSLTQFVPRVLRAYGPQKLGPGDGILANDPYMGGVHLNDITLMMPVYDLSPNPSPTKGGESDSPFPEREGGRGDRSGLLGYVASLAHHVDVGGGSPGSIGAFREVYQEGVIIPPVKLVEGGQIVQDIFGIVLAQIRSKRETAGDLRAQLAANVTGVRRLGDMVQRLGLDTFEMYVEELLAYTERRARAELARLPHGVHRAEGQVDNDGYTDQPVRLVATVTVNDAGVQFDFTGSDPQRRAPVNSTYAMTFAACAYVLRCLMPADVPINDGFYRLVHMVAPDGTVVNCTHPAPVVGGWETQTRLVDIIFRALSQAIPDRVPAGTKAMMCQAAFGGMDTQKGELYAFYEALAGGYGGRATRDGPDAVQAHGQNTENAPIEETEVNYPVRFARYELVENSDGPGQQRGGLGLRRDYLFPNEATFTILADRDRAGPHGLFGGEAGQTARYVLNPDTPDERRLGSKTTVILEPGDVVSFQTCGGGGYGPPLERDPNLVLIDVREGKISLARARDLYGVVIDRQQWTVDQDATHRLRVDSRSGG